MWLASKYGFYSIVKNFDRKGFLVRARKKQDLLNLMSRTETDAEITELEKADYRYRLIINSSDYEKVMNVLTDSVDYPNFKNMIADRNDQREKLGAYHEIWRIMHSLQE